MSHVPRDMIAVKKEKKTDTTNISALKVLKERQQQGIAVILELRARDTTLWSCCTPM